MLKDLASKENLRVEQVPVFIIGAGPSGLTSAALLARSGIEVLAVSQHPGTANTPRAHITNTRAMEVFRDLDIEDKVYEVGSFQEMENVSWCTSLAGKELVRLNAWGYGDDRRSDYLTASPSKMCNAPQHVLEPVLLDVAREYGAQFRFNTKVIDIEQDDDKVRSLLEDRASGEQYLVESDYAVGADGARSIVASKLGFEFEGEMGQGHAIMCWFKADLSRYCADRRAVVIPILEPGNDDWIGGGTFICVRPWDEWVLLSMYDPENEAAATSEPAVINRVYELIGNRDTEVEIKAIAPWTINNMFAKQMVKGRVVIQGDAAHRHPPSGGLGSNTCVQDAFNLAWKLALVADGKAGPALLESYGEERQPVARQMVNRAITAMVNMQAVPQALGFKPGQSAEDGWAALDSFAAPTEDGKVRRKAFREAIALQNWQFNGLGGEAGHFYANTSAVISDGIVPEFNAENDQLQHHASSAPGASLPHAWLQQNGKSISSIDLVGKTCFTVITGPNGEAWLRSAEELAGKLGIDIRGVRVSVDGEITDLSGAWSAVSEIEDDGCLLVRPDRFIAYRAKTMTTDTNASLMQAMEKILARKTGA